MKHNARHAKLLWKAASAAVSTIWIGTVLTESGAPVGVNCDLCMEPCTHTTTVGLDHRARVRFRTFRGAEDPTIVPLSVFAQTFFEGDAIRAEKEIEIDTSREKERERERKREKERERERKREKERERERKREKREKERDCTASGHIHPCDESGAPLFNAFFEFAKQLLHVDSEMAALTADLASSASEQPIAIRSAALSIAQFATQHAQQTPRHSSVRSPRLGSQMNTTHPTKCAYRSKPCPNTRAIKMNGEFHRLCEYHRRRANLNQQRVHQRRKMRELCKKQQEQKPYFDETAAPYPISAFNFAWSSGLSSPTGADKCYDEDILTDSEIGHAFDFVFDCEPSLSPCGDLPLPDLEILERLLSEASPSIRFARQRTTRHRQSSQPATTMNSLAGTITPSAPSSTNTASHVPPPEIKCSYRSKPCHNMRATKLNGEFHKLCEYHRRRANLNQQRVHQRRKLREFSEQQALGARSSITESLSDIEFEFEFDFDLECEPSSSPCGDLPLSDLEILELLLSDTHTATAASPRTRLPMSKNCKRQRALADKTPALPRATPAKREEASSIAAAITGSAGVGSDSTGLMRCGYRSKLCNNDRVFKQNGEYHKLCEYHRRRANLNQQRVHQRRKFRLKQSKMLQKATPVLLPVGTPSSRSDGSDSLYVVPTPPSSPEVMLESLRGIQPPEVASALEPFTSPCGDLSLYDLIILEALLFDSASGCLQTRVVIHSSQRESLMQSARVSAVCPSTLVLLITAGNFFVTNTSEWTVERRKIMRQKMIDAKQQYLASVANSSPSSFVPKIKIEGLLEPCPHPCGAKFSAEDLQLLELMLFDADELSMSNDDAFLQSLDVTI
ncbi:hypothetical protein PybrP1_004140 [[Pythium] brassicae (nom. inval.)]|nr:hypothetical protein PybrP1_004140 [[Pythium] brassicae (nom. inval.)]